MTNKINGNGQLVLVSIRGFLLNDEPSETIRIMVEDGRALAECEGWKKEGKRPCERERQTLNEEKKKKERTAGEIGNGLREREVELLRWLLVVAAASARIASEMISRPIKP